MKTNYVWKKLSLTLAFIVAFGYSSFACNYQLKMVDSYGDGWNGGKVTVYVNGTAVLTDQTLASGAGPLYVTFAASTGDSITTDYTSGSWSTENEYSILNATGTVIATQGAGSATPGDITTPLIAACPIALDAGLTLIDAGDCVGLKGVAVELKNFGVDTLFSATINWSVNGVAQTAYSWSDTLITGEVALVTIGSYNFSTSVPLVAYTSAPNSSTDGNAANDTITGTFTPATNAITTFPWAENFDSYSNGNVPTSGLSNGWWCNTTSNPRWIIDNGGTPSSSTGPSIDNTTGASSGKYVFLETSGGTTGSTSYFTSPCLSFPNANAPKMDFYYHMYGSAMGTLAVEQLVNGVWVQVWSISGQQQSSGTAAWVKKTVNLSPMVSKVRFAGIRGTSYTSDMAIDDIKIYDPQPNDLAMDAWISPQSGTSPDTAMVIKVAIKNVGTATQDTFVVKYSVDGGTTIVSETVNDSIQPSDTMIYTFATTANMGATAYYECGAVVQNTGDVYSGNDTLFAGLWIGNPLSGTYTIGYDATDDFSSIGNAITAMQNFGVSGAVTFLLDDTTFNEHVALVGPITGASTSNTITFKGNGPSTIITAVTNSGNRDVFRITNQDYVTIDSLSIIANSNTNYSCGIRIMESDSVTVQNCNISVPTNISSSYTNGILVVGSAANYYTATVANYLTIKNNVITGGYCSLKLYGNSSNHSTNAQVDNNQMLSFYYYGLYAYYQDSVDFKKNTITSRPNSYGYGIYAYRNYLGSRIAYNKITMNTTSGGYGLYANYCEGTSATFPFRVYNNSISVPNASGSPYGIYSYYGKNLYYFYNTIRIGNGGTSSRGMYIYGSTSSSQYENIKIKNNILVNDGNGYSLYMQGAYFPAKVTECDYNDLYTSGSKFARYGSDKADLAAWQASATNLGANSKSINPQFKSNNVLAATSIPMNNMGTPIVGIDDDINDTLRNTSTPDMGAYEYTPPANDLAVVEWITPQTGVALSSTITVSVRVVNFGTASQSNFPIKYSIDGGQTVVSEIVVGPLASTDTMVYTFTATANMSTYGTYHCVSYPSITTEENPLNDTVFYDVMACSPFSGVATLGNDANDMFGSFSELSTALSSCGVSGPFTVLVDSGIFDDHTTFYAVPGASNTNTITIKGYGDQTVVHNSSADSYNRYVLNFNGAKYFILDSLTIEKDSNVNYFWGAHFMNQADSNTIRNCTFRGNGATSSNVIAIVASNSLTSYYTGGNTANNLVIDNNTITDGYYGISMRGTSSNTLCNNNSITNNDISGFYNYGVYLYYQNASAIMGNIINSSNHTSYYAAAIYSSYSKNAINISKNRIDMERGSYAIYLYRHNYYSNQDTGFVSNNFIRVNRGNGGNGYGIYNYYSKKINYYNNSVNITGYRTTSVAFYMYYSSSAITLKNNVFANHAKGYAIYSRVSGSNFENDYNNLYTNGNYLAYLSGNRSSLSAWQSASSDGANSLNVDPEFFTPTDLHTFSIPMMNSGTPLFGVVDDIDDTLRSTTTPDMGADEYDVPYNNLSAIEVVYDFNPWCGTNDSLYVVIKNLGLATQYTVPVSFVGTSPSGAISLTGTIDSIHSLELDTVYVGVLNALASGMYDAVAYATISNDGYPQNDTIDVSGEVYFPDTVEYFEDYTTSHPVHWDMTGNGTRTWSHYGSTAVKAGFFNQSSGNTSEMISPAVSIPSNMASYVGFNYSYKEYTGSIDSLEVYVKQCGTSNWVRVWVKGGADLSSGSNSSTSPGTYKDAHAMIPASMQGSNIRVMFRGISDYGSNLFIDGMAVFNAPSVDLGPDTAACGGNTITFDAGTFFKANYLWTRGIDTVGTAQTYTASTSGSYVAHVSQFGVAGIDAVTATFNVVPMANFTGLNATYCDNEMASTLMPTPAGGMFTGNGINGNMFDPATAGVGNHIVTYTFTTTAGCTSIATDTTDVFEAPAVALMDTAICEGDSVMFSAGTAAPAAPGLIFSMYIEGSGNNKAIEVYNATTDTLNLDDYSIMTNYNGNPWSGQYHFPAGYMLAPSDVFVIANENADPAILAVADDSLAYNAGGYIVGFNGDDVRALYKHNATDSVMIDIIGRYDLVDPGSGWDVAGVSSATKDHSIVRKSTIVGGNTDWDAIAGTDSVSSEYLVYPKNTFMYLGSHSATAPAPVSYTYLWSTGDTTATITVTPTTTTTYTVTVDNGTCTTFDSAVVTVNALPVVNLGNDTTIKWTYGVVTLDAGNPNASSWNWSTGDVYQIVTFTNANLSNSAPNVISVEVTENGCSASDTIVITAVNDISIEESIANMNVEVYPNPTKGQFNLAINGFEGDLEMAIVDLAGQTVHSEKISVTVSYNNKFDMSKLASGVYYIKLISKGGVKVQKLIIQ
jgi:hypothetical protein